MRSDDLEAPPSWTVVVEGDPGTRITFQDRQRAEECARALAVERRPSHVVVVGTDVTSAPSSRFDAI